MGDWIDYRVETWNKWACTAIPMLRPIDHGLIIAKVEEVMREAYEMGRRADALRPLAERIAKGQAKYPNGCTVLSLLDEAGEVAHAVNKYETAERVREELLDVAAVAMRLYFGEVDRGLEIDGLTQRRTDSAKGVAK